MVMVSFLILGIAFVFLGRSYVINDARDKMEANAEEVSRSAQALTREGELNGWELRMTISAVSKITGNQIFISDPAGVIISCSDMNIACDHLGRQIDPAVFIQLRSSETFNQMTNLYGFYDTPHYVVAQAIQTVDGAGVMGSTITLCEAMRDHGVKKIIFSSSATVYSGDNEMPLYETSRTGNCTNPYGWTKYMCEQILRDYVVADPTWSVVLLRYFNPVGAHESGLIGEDPRGIPNNLMPYISQTAIGRRECLNIFGNDYDTPDGTGVRDYIHVVDLARGHVAAITYMDGHPGESVFNLGTSKGYSVLDMVHAFESANHVKVPYRFTARRPGDLPICYACPDKSAQVLSWRAQYNLEDMCRDSWNWQTKNPNGYGG